MKKIRELKEINVEEISLVSSAASRNVFFITKQRRKTMKKFLEILKNFFGDELEDEDIKKAEGIEEDAQKALGDALETIDEYRDDYTPDVLAAILKVSKAAVTPEEEVEEPDFVAELTDVEKAGARLSKATIAQLKKIVEIAGNMLAASEKKLGKKKDDENEYTPEVIAALEKLEAYETAEVEAEKQALLDAKSETDKKLDAMAKEIEKLKKQKPVKKGLESDDDELTPEEIAAAEKLKKKGGDQEEAQWPSLCNQEGEED